MSQQRNESDIAIVQSIEMNLTFHTKDSMGTLNLERVFSSERNISMVFMFDFILRLWRFQM